LESGGGSEEDLAGFETGLEANRTCSGEQEVQREGLVQRQEKDWTCGISCHLPVRSQKLYKSLKILASKVLLSGHLEALSNGYWGQARLQRKVSFQGLRSGVR
jgi:hypothetical protein